MRFKNKVCLVSGGASGIGRATALAFASEGGKVVLSDVSDTGSEVVKSIKDQGGEAIYTKCDISDWSQVQGLVDFAVASYGRLDCAVNSAGISGAVSLPTHEYPMDAWDKQLSINLTGPWYFLKATTAQMLKNGGGSIVLVGSAAGLRGHVNNSPYAAAKHGVIGITRTAALEYATDNIRVNCICPTAIATPMLMHGRRNLAENPEALAAAQNYQAMKRMGQPEEVAQVNLWLCSDQASFITGRDLPVDGGALIK